jgi:ferritin-like metal-binding protein YciE
MNKSELLLLAKMADLYDTEKLLLQTLPKMGKAAKCKHLKEAILCHLETTQAHIAAIEETFSVCQLCVVSTNGDATEAHWGQASDGAGQEGHSPAFREILVTAVQKVEQYEVATYACLHEWAELLGSNQASSILEEILEEEAADRGR